jgi:hypothetical protein
MSFLPIIQLSCGEEKSFSDFPLGAHLGQCEPTGRANYA